MVLVDLRKFLAMPEKSRKNNFVYLIANEGIFAFFENDIFKVCVPVLKAFRPGAPSISELMENEKLITVKRKIPFHFYTQIHEFYNENRNIEKCLLIIWDGQEFKLYEPFQEGSSAHVNYEVPYGQEIVATIHNHPGNFGSFSSIDDRDTQFLIGADILVYYTPEVNLKARFSLLGKTFPLHLRDLFAETGRESLTF